MPLLGPKSSPSWNKLLKTRVPTATNDKSLWMFQKLSFIWNECLHMTQHLEMTIIDVMMMVIIDSLSVWMFKHSKFFCSYSDYLKPLWALVLYFNFSVGIIRVAICRKLQIADNFHRNCKYLSKKLKFQNSPKIKRSIFSQLKRLESLQNLKINKNLLN